MSAYLNIKTNEYPRHIGDLYLLGYKDGDALPEDWVLVTPTEEPKVEEGQIAKETAPKLINGEWLQQWEIVTFTAEEIMQMNEQKKMLDNFFNKLHNQE